MKPSIFFTVIEIRLDAITDNKPIVFVDCYVTGIKDTMNISSEQDSISYAVRTSNRIRLDVGGV